MIKNKVVVGILPTYDYSDTDPYANRTRYVRMYEEMIRECGAIPLGLLSRDLSLYYDLCDAYIWPGGNVIEKDFYRVFDDILSNKKPLLGICMGAQAISIYFNVLQEKKDYPSMSVIEIYDMFKKDKPYLKKIDEKYLDRHFNIVTFEEESLNSAKHNINIKHDTFMYDIYKKDNISVISLHSYEIARVSNDVLVSSLSDDGVIESLEYHNDGNHILGIQYHPEVIHDKLPFEWLINNACK